MLPSARNWHENRYFQGWLEKEFMTLFTGEPFISSVLGLLLVIILLGAGVYGLFATKSRPEKSSSTPDPKPPLSPHSLAVGIVQSLIQADLLTGDKFKLATEIAGEKLRAALQDA